METPIIPVAHQPLQPQQLSCVICHCATIRLVDGEPSCDAHANLVYEDQMEAYIKAHLSSLTDKEQF